jgi:RHS repeat-associated protein
LSADVNWTYTYDKEGNLKEKDTTTSGSSEKWTYAYSSTNELTEVKYYDSAGTLVRTVDYTYDAFGEVIQSDDGTTVAKFGVDGWNSNMPSPTGNENFNVWARLNGSGSLTNRYLWGNNPDQQLGRVDYTGSAYQTFWPLEDHLNSVRDVINNSGVVKDAIQYDGFGKVTAETDPSYRGWYAFTGKEFDQNTDLQYNHARYYDARTGRWISQDPLGFDAGDSNLYRYVTNAPTSATDPSGLQEFWRRSSAGPWHWSDFTATFGIGWNLGAWDDQKKLGRELDAKIADNNKIINAEIQDAKDARKNGADVVKSLKVGDTFNVPTEVMKSMKESYKMSTSDKKKGFFETGATIIFNGTSRTVGIGKRATGGANKVDLPYDQELLGAKIFIGAYHTHPENAGVPSATDLQAFFSKHRRKQGDVYANNVLLIYAGPEGGTCAIVTTEKASVFALLDPFYQEKWKGIMNPLRKIHEDSGFRRTDLLVEGTGKWLKKYGADYGVEFYYGNQRGAKEGVLKRVYP